MSTKNVRKFFIAVLIFLPLQYILVGIVGYYKAEPWPAFVFPGFKNVYEIGKTYQIHQTRFEVFNSSEEKVASLAPNLFFESIPRSQIDGLTRTLFQKKTKVESLSPEAKIFMFENSKRLSNHEVSKLNIVYRKDFLTAGSKSLEIDSVNADTIGTIQIAIK